MADVTGSSPNDLILCFGAAIIKSLAELEHAITYNQAEKVFLIIFSIAHYFATLALEDVLKMF